MLEGNKYKKESMNLPNKKNLNNAKGENRKSEDLLKNLSSILSKFYLKGF